MPELEERRHIGSVFGEVSAEDEEDGDAAEEVEVDEAGFGDGEIERRGLGAHQMKVDIMQRSTHNYQMNLPRCVSGILRGGCWFRRGRRSGGCGWRIRRGFGGVL